MASKQRVTKTAFRLTRSCCNITDTTYHGLLAQANARLLQKEPGVQHMTEARRVCSPKRKCLHSQAKADLLYPRAAPLAHISESAAIGFGASLNHIETAWSLRRGGTPEHHRTALNGGLPMNTDSGAEHTCTATNGGKLALKQLEPAAVHEQKDAEILRHQTYRDLAQLRRIHMLVP